MAGARRRVLEAESPTKLEKRVVKSEIHDENKHQKKSFNSTVSDLTNKKSG